MAATKKLKVVGRKKPISTPTKPRRRKEASYRSFRLQRKIRPVTPPLPSAFRLLKSSLSVIRAHWRVLLGITVAYAMLTLFLVRGFGAGVDTAALKSELNDVFSGKWSGLLSAGVIFSAVASSSGGTTSGGSAGYGPIIVIANSLAIIWALRQLLSSKTIKIRDAYYKGLYPIVPFILILAVISLQLIPLSLGTWLYSTVVSKFIAVTAIEKFLWFLLFMLLSVLSVYMLCSSMFALFIVSLPNMTPMKALRSARQLVLHRRWIVMRKVLFLPLVLLLVCAFVMLPFLIWLPVLAEPVYFLLSCFGLTVAIVYMYQLYRELLNE